MTKHAFSLMNWFFMLLIIGTIVIGLFYLPAFWKITQTVILTAVGVATLYITFEKAKSRDYLELERLRKNIIIDNLREGVVAYDEEFKILIFNKASEEIFELNGKEVVGKSFTLKLKKERSQRLLPLLTVLFPALAPTIIRRSEHGQFPQIVDITLERPVRELRVTTNRIEDENGTILGFIKLIQDRTRQLALLRSKSQFVTVASHQLRTPLTGANWALETLQNEPLTDEQKKLVETASGSLNRMLKVVNDMLDIAKIEEGRFGYEFQEIDLNKFLEQALRETEAVAKQYKIKLYFEKPNEPVNVTVDSQKLSMAISNLLDNAVKYNVENGEVALSIKKIPGRQYVQVDIRDTGIGIGSEAIEQVFKKFFRGDNAVKVAVEGTGLGLYITKNIIERHGGKIWAESTLNRGTTFHFTLPTNYLLIPPKEAIYDEAM